jgi:hypothetical protein
MSMSNEEFIGYLGDPDFHDGHVVTVSHEGDTTCVRLRGASGREFVVEFCGVRAMRSKQPEGMMIYALSEMRAPSPLRLFVFANWDEEDESFLEIEAENFRVTEAHTTQQT